MSENTIVSFSSPEFEDQLSELLCNGAREFIVTAVEAELTEFLAEHGERRDARGRRAVMRNGYQPERSALSGVGPVDVRIPRTQDCSGAGIGFRSRLVPPYLKNMRRVEEVIPCLASRSKGSQRTVLARVNRKSAFAPTFEAAGRARRDAPDHVNPCRPRMVILSPPDCGPRSLLFDLGLGSGGFNCWCELICYTNPRTVASMG